MTTLNRAAKDAALAAGAHAATDVTGFGLLGHLHHLAAASGLSARVFADAVPTLDFVRSLAAEGMVPGGSKDNLAYVEPHGSFDPTLSEVERLILADAQTSGGLLIAVPPEGEASLLRELAERGTPARAVVGELLSGEPGSLAVVRGGAT
jgi:selenide,water dikinase